MTTKQLEKKYLEQHRHCIEELRNFWRELIWRKKLEKRKQDEHTENAIG